MTRTELLKKVAALNVWKRGSQRAPHKPLLVLYSLARLQRGNDERLIPFAEVDKQLTDLLKRFGPPRQSFHPEYPYWRLKTDGIWEVPDSEKFTRRKSSTDIPRGELLRQDAHAGFTEEVLELFKSDPAFVMETVRMILEANFPDSFHQDILDSLGLTLQIVKRKPRDPAFRIAVIQAYEHSCAVCGYDVKLGTVDLALEAAHIKWHQVSGPDTVQNGLALCSLHHKAFDRGAIGLTDERRIVISADVYGQSWVHDWFLRFKGQSLRSPHNPSLVPCEEYIHWHQREVFQGPAG